MIALADDDEIGDDDLNDDVGDDDSDDDVGDDDLNDDDDEVDDNDREEDDDNDNDRDDDLVDDDREEYEERDVEIDLDSTEVKIESDWERNGLDDEFDLQFSTDDELKITLDFTLGHNKTNTDVEFEVVIDKIIEYNDTNGNGRYDEDDAIVSTYNLEKAAFEKITYKTEKRSGNETVHIISARTVDGVFGIVLYVVGNFTSLESGTLAPTEAKVDFIIHYNYHANDSQVTLKVKINTDYDTESDIRSYGETHGYAKNESELRIIGNHTGYFSWAEYALIDNISKPVNVTIVENHGKGFDEKDVVYFCYPRGKTIVHDPKVGVIGVSSLTFVQGVASIMQNIGIYALVCAVASIFIIGSIYIRKRM